MVCNICGHAKRVEIENALLSMNSENKEVTIESIAAEFGVTANDVKIHALMHSNVGITEIDKPTIARQMKLREADMLAAVANEYMVTLKNVGRRVNKLANSEMFEKLINKSIVDLYIGLGGEVRQTIKTLAELHSLINGPDNGNSSGLHALANAIVMSKQRKDDE